MNEAEYQELRREAEKTKSAAERAKGALKQLKKQLQEEFGCATVKEAKLKLAELTQEEKQSEAEFSRRWRDYKEKWMQ